LWRLASLKKVGSTIFPTTLTQIYEIFSRNELLVELVSMGFAHECFPSCCVLFDSITSNLIRLLVHCLKRSPNVFKCRTMPLPAEIGLFCVYAFSQTLINLLLPIPYHSSNAFNHNIFNNIAVDVIANILVVMAREEGREVCPFTDVQNLVFIFLFSPTAERRREGGREPRYEGVWGGGGGMPD